MGKKQGKGKGGGGSSSSAGSGSGSGSIARLAAPAVVLIVAAGVGLWLSSRPPSFDAPEVLRSVRSGVVSGSDALAEGSVGKHHLADHYTGLLASTRPSGAEKAEAALALVLLTALMDADEALDPALVERLASFRPDESYSSRLGSEYGVGLGQRRQKPPLRKAAPVPMGGWIGAAIEGAAIGEPVRTERGEVTLYSRRPLVVVIDGFLSAADAAAAVDEHDRVFDARKRDGETVCFNTKMTPAKRARMTKQLTELAQRDQAKDWAVTEKPGLICVPTTPSIFAKFRRASTSINFELGSSPLIDGIDSAVAESIGLLSEADRTGDEGYSDSAVQRVAGGSTCGQLLRYFPPLSTESEAALAEGADALDVSTAYELHTDCHDYVGDVMQEPADRSISALLYLTSPESGGHTSFPVVNVSVPPKAGRLLLFQSLDETGRCDPLSAHIGHAPSSGTVAKFAWQKWFLAAPSPADRRSKELAVRSAMQTMCDLELVCRSYLRTTANDNKTVVEMLEEARPMIKRAAKKATKGDAEGALALYESVAYRMLTAASSHTDAAGRQALGETLAELPAVVATVQKLGPRLASGKGARAPGSAATGKRHGKLGGQLQSLAGVAAQFGVRVGGP